MDECDKEVPLDNPEMDIPEMEGIPQETGTDETIPTPVGEADEGNGRAWFVVHCYSGYENKVRHLMKMLIRAIYYHCLTIRKMPVIAVSEQLADFFSDTFKTYVIAVDNGVDLSAFYRDRKRDYLNMKGSSPVILLFSRSDYRKGYDIALNVISRFSEDIENKVVTLWSVGEKIDTPYEVTQFGTVSPDDLRAILSCSDVFLYPSRHEGFGLLPLEAIACGCPVVTSDRVPSVKDGAGAIIRPYDDIDGFAQSIRSLLYDEALKCDLMQKGSEFVKQHSIAKSRQRFEQEILSIHSQMAFAVGGGFVFNGTHNLQNNVPTENLLALFRAINDSRSA